MFAFAKRYLALAAAVTIAATVSTGCSGGAKSNEDAVGKVKFAVSAAGVTADITSMKLVIDAMPGSVATTPGFPIELGLSKAPAGAVWTANVSNIPTSATGRTFTAQAFGGAGGTTLLYTGSTVAPVSSGAPAQVTIILQEQNVTPGPTNYAPVISAITASNSFVLPGQAGTFAVTAYDPDDAAHFNRPAFNGSPLSYKWTASCDTAGATLVIANDTAATTGFTAPSVGALCTVAIKVTETALSANSSVTTYFTLFVNGNLGSADVSAFPNSFPMVTVRGDFRYNFFSDVTTMGIGQRGDLFFTALDVDGDNVRFDLTGSCGSGFDAVDGQLTNGIAIAANQFSGVSFTTTAGTGVSPTAIPFSWNPTFAYPSPVVAFTDPSKACQFKVVVHDLCTAGNCGPSGAPGAIADGQFKVTKIGALDVTSSTTGILNATAPSQPRRAPSIVRAIAPNQSGGAIATGVAQTWDPQKFAVVQPGGTGYVLQAEAYDQYEAGPLGATWSCNSGSAPLGGIVNTPTPGDGKALKSLISWAAPTPLLSNMFCTVTFTSSASSLSTVVTFRFAGSDPCSGQPDGTSCNDNNACTTGTTCTAGVCGSPTSTVTCSVAAGDQCHVAGVCNPNTGTCSTPNAPDGTTCNADSNGCTMGDFCQAGACTAGAAPTTCPNAPANAYCYDAAGTCSSTGNNTYTCNFAPSGTTRACTVANATTKCSTTNIFSAFACDGAGACVGNTPVSCVGGAQCVSGGACDPANGTCAGGTASPAGTACTADADPCTTDACNGAGSCVASPLCAPGQICNPATPACFDPVPRPAYARQVPGKQLNGVALTTAGVGIAGGQVGCTIDVATNACLPITFEGTVTVTPAGANDAYVSAYDPATPYATRWASLLVGQGEAASASTQAVTSVATTAGGVVVALGSTDGGLLSANSAINLPNSGVQVFLASLNSAGAALSGIQFGIGGGIVYNLASYQNKVAFCGATDQTTLFAPAGHVFAGAAGSRDAIIAVYNVNATTGAATLDWSKQLGGGADEFCGAVAFDDLGNLVVAGQYNWVTGQTLLDPGMGPLPDPNGSPAVTPNSNRRHLWVAKYDTTGAIVSQASFGNLAANGAVTPKAVAVDSSGNVAVVGSFTVQLPLTGLVTIVSAGNTDAFALKLSSTFVPVWSSRIGAAGTAADVASTVAFTSSGDALVGGAHFGPTTGAAVFPYTTGHASEAFLLKYSPTGLVQFSAAYGGAGSQGMNQIAVNRAGTGTVKDAVLFGGPYDTAILFPPLTVPLPATAGAAYLTWAPLGL
jgi:hypothetical protein